ncbi:MAG: DUF3090 domain-containing protein [Candidatus Nanopelagicales bacterium]
MRILYEFTQPERFIVGTVGMPGERSFYLQVTNNKSVVSVAIEKGQASVLANGLEKLLDDLYKMGHQVPMAEPGDLDLEPLSLPIDIEFVAYSMGLAWNAETELLTLEIHAESEDIPDVEENPENGPDCLRVRINLQQARGFIARTQKVVAAGRPICTFCQYPIDPQGHICPRSNGFRRGV